MTQIASLTEPDQSFVSGTFGEDVLELHGVRARVIGREALIVDKSIVRDDAVAAAKDRADIVSLGGAGKAARNTPNEHGS